MRRDMDHQRSNQHYLGGSLHCGGCGSRLMLAPAKNKFGSLYPYYVCVGRVRKTTDCTRQAMHSELLEQLIEDEYRTIALSPDLRDAVDDLIQEDFETLKEASGRERQLLDQQRITLTAQRQKLHDAHYTTAIPLDLLKTEQDRIASQLTRIQGQLDTAASDFDRAKQLLAETLDLARDCDAAYLEADDPTRRLFNQAFFTKIYIDEVELRGFEPLAFSLRTRRATNCATAPRDTPWRPR
jgi:site-specific DNA recombinase